MADGLSEIVRDEGFKEERTGCKGGSCREKVGHCARGEYGVWNDDVANRCTL